MRSSLSGMGRTAPYDRNERFGGPNRLSGPPAMSRLSRFRGTKMPIMLSTRFSRLKLSHLLVGDAEWDDYGDGYWNRGGPGPVGRVKPPMRSGYEDDDYMDGPRHFVHMRGLPYRAIEDDIALVKIFPSCLHYGDNFKSNFFLNSFSDLWNLLTLEFYMTKLNGPQGKLLLNLRATKKRWRQ